MRRLLLAVTLSLLPAIAADDNLLIRGATVHPVSGPEIICALRPTISANRSSLLSKCRYSVSLEAPAASAITCIVVSA